MSFPLGCAAESMTSVSMGTRRGGRGKDEKFQWREGMKTRRKKKKVKEAARWKSIPWRDVDNPVPCQNTLRFFCLPSSPAPCISLSILPGSLLLLLLPSSFLPFHCSFFYSSPLHPLSTAGRYRIIYNVSPFWKRDFRLGYLYPVPGLTWKYCKLVTGSRLFSRFYQITVIPWKYRVLLSRNLPGISRSTFTDYPSYFERFRRNIEIKEGGGR